MTTDFTNNNTTIAPSGGFQPKTKNTPLDVRTRVNSKSDIDSIPNPFVGMKIIVLQDETNDNQMTEYVVTSLKANALGIADMKINEVVLTKDFLGVRGNGMTDEQVQQLNAAYTHSQTPHVQQSQIPTKVSQLQNDSDFATNASVDEKIANVGTGGIVPVTQVEPLDDDIPKVFFNGDKPTNKTSVYATIEYISKTKRFKGYVDIKCQGTSSMSYPKKNYTIKIFTDETMETKLKQDFKGWGKQNKFCLKANYIDHSHARNICSAKLWNEIVGSRSNYEALPELLRTSPKNGAIDGFPIKVYYNNTYEGLYTWNIPKDKWMFNMDDKLDNHCVLCGEEYNSGCFRSANASLWSDEIHDVMPQSIITSFNNFITFVMNSSDEEFRANLENYVYVDSLIDYYIFQYVICGLDSMGKNQLFATYDGTKWIATSYDMDSTFGLYWNGQSFVSAQYRMQEDYESMVSGRPGNLLYFRLEQIFPNEIRARYDELRNSVLSYANVVNTFERFMDIPGKDLYAEDGTIHTGIPSQTTNNIQQIRNYYRGRLTYVDGKIAELRVPVPCTAISLSANTLSLTNDNKTATLVATVTPPDTTDTIVWSVAPKGICRVNNGKVTAKANGNCVVTATCGEQSATCTVNVSGLSQQVFNKVFSIDSTCLNTEANTLIDKVSGINFSMTGAPTISDNKIVFTEADTFSGEVSSLGLTNTTARTLRIKFTPTSLSDSIFSNVVIIGNSESVYGESDTIYIRQDSLRVQWGNTKTITDKTVGVDSSNNTVNRLTGNPELNHEYEIILSQNSDGSLRYWIDGVLVQDGKMSPRNNWNYLGNAEGNGRFVGSYSLIELYEQYFNEYPNFDEQPVPDDTLFELSEPFVGDGTSKYIDTGIRLMNEENKDKDWTMFITFSTTNTSTPYQSLVHCMTEASPFPGFSIDLLSANLRIVAPNNNVVSPIVTVEPGRIYSYAIVKNGLDFTLYDSVGSIVRSIPSTNGAAITATSANMVLGAYYSGTEYGRFLDGRIYNFEIKSEIYTSDEITEYFAGIEIGGVQENALVYSLNEERTLNGTSDYINTEIPLLDKDRDFTIFLDFTKSSITDNTNNQRTLLHCMTETSPYPGIAIQTLKTAGNVLQLSGQGISVSHRISAADTNRHKIIIVKQGNTIKTTTEADVFTSAYTHANTSRLLLIGCYQSATGEKGRFYDATIHQAKVWTKAISDEEVQQLLNS